MMDFADYYSGELPWLKDALILLTKHGPHAYGLNTPTSDLDVKGIAIPPKRYFHGFLHRFEQAEGHAPVDLVVFDIRKFMALAADCNPNVIEILWTDDADLLFCSSAGRMLRDRRVQFLSTKARHTFSGYAMAQLKRIKTHRKWLLSPPAGKPSRGDFGLPETSLMSPDQRGAVEALTTDARATLPESVMAIYEKERAYHNALREWTQFQNWQANRNPDRAKLEAAHGYDCKHAMHLVRLMRMCGEILEGQGVQVRRPDRDELLAIRDGAWSYDDLLAWATAQDERMAALEADSPLPKKPNREKLDELCRTLVERRLDGLP